MRMPLQRWVAHTREGHVKHGQSGKFRQKSTTNKHVDATNRDIQQKTTFGSNAKHSNNQAPTLKMSQQSSPSIHFLLTSIVAIDVVPERIPQRNRQKPSNCRRWTTVAFPVASNVTTNEHRTNGQRMNEQRMNEQRMNEQRMNNDDDNDGGGGDGDGHGGDKLSTANDQRPPTANATEAPRKRPASEGLSWRSFNFYFT